MHTVPNLLVRFWFSSILRDVPKSIILRFELGFLDSNKMFSGLRSRCTIFFAWQCTTPARICFMMSAAIFSEKCFMSVIFWNNSPPSRYLDKCIRTLWPSNSSFGPETIHGASQYWGGRAIWVCWPPRTCSPRPLWWFCPSWFVSWPSCIQNSCELLVSPHQRRLHIDYIYLCPNSSQFYSDC